MGCSGLRRLALVLVTTMIVSRSVGAQENSSTPDLRRLTGPGDTIEITETSGKRVRGKVLDLSPEVVNLAIAAADQTRRIDGRNWSRDSRPDRADLCRRGDAVAPGRRRDDRRTTSPRGAAHRRSAVEWRRGSAISVEDACQRLARFRRNESRRDDVSAILKRRNRVSLT